MTSDDAMPATVTTTPLTPAVNRSAALASVCLAVVGKRGAAAVSQPPKACAAQYSGFRIARCSGHMLGEPPHFSNGEHDPSVTYAEKVCVDHRLSHAISTRRCLVYGIGVATDWTFERSLAMQGCEVHLFDPTISHGDHPDPWLRSITFHEWGLYSAITHAFNGSKDARALRYGLVRGTLLSLGAIRHRLGHADRTISVLKVDCEGCEWEALSIIPRSTWDQVDQFVAELHMGTQHSFHSDTELSQATQLVEHLSSTGLRLWYSEPNVGRRTAIWPPLLHAGYPASAGCCVQQGWIRP